MKKGDKKVIRGWVMYDWANSVYQLTIASAIFPIYYNQVTRSENSDLISFFGLEVRNTVLYSWAIAAAYLVVAICSPLFSSIADYTGRRKLFMRIFTWIGALSCGALFFFTGRNTIEFGVIAFALATLGYGGSLVFYNSFLPVIAEEKDQDRISARGYAMGYLGGVVLLLFNLLMIIKPALFGIHDGSLPARISFLSVFVWWIGFSQITFKRLPKYTYGRIKNEGHALWYGYQELIVVFHQVRKSHRLTLFLAGFFFTMMGLLTVMFMAATFGEKELHLTESVLIPTILVIQLVGMVGAWFFARLSERIGNIQALLIAITLWVFICFGAYLITNAAGFITAAFFIGMVMGGTQSLARSTYSKMIPETKDHTSFFSFYDVMEKLATVAGTFSFGLIEMITGSMRYSILVISIFFILGMTFLFIVYNIERATIRPSYLTQKK